VLSRWIGDTYAIVHGPESQFRTEDGGETQCSRSLGETDNAVKATVVSQGQGPEAKADGLGHELLGVTRTIEEAKARVGVQFTVERH
jgi:hypothetical protein